MSDPWRYACPNCGSRQVRRRAGMDSGETRCRHVCLYGDCDARAVDAVDLATA